MARHPEVSEQQIIDAGLALEKRGKRPNAGAIRVQLGDRGGLARIKSIWENYQNQINQLTNQTIKRPTDRLTLRQANRSTAQATFQANKQASKQAAPLEPTS